MMNFKDPLVLILNIIVIFILIFLILPTLLNKREKIGIRVSFSIIFLVVIVNCISNLTIFYFENYNLLQYHFALMSIPFLFGPAIYFYVKEINGSRIKNILPHLLLPAAAFLIGFSYVLISHDQQLKILNEISAGSYLPYNLVNTAVILVPQFYFVKSKLWLKKLELNESDPLFTQKKIKKNWANEFVNYMIFSVLSFLLIAVIATYILKIPQIYLDLIAMPLYFPFIYSIVAVRSNMISKELEIQYVLSKSEQESKLKEERINISRDLHDNIGAYANSLISKIDYISASKDFTNADQIMDLKENAENILSLLRQTIWVLNTDEISVESSFDSLKQYALKNFLNTNIKVSFSENIAENKILNSTVASTIFRIVQESLQNVMKHSKADQVKISLTSNDYFEIRIEDNGIGFSEQNFSTTYGLKNMQERAKSINMILKIESEINKGTRVSITDSLQ